LNALLGYHLTDFGNRFSIAGVAVQIFGAEMGVLHLTITSPKYGASIGSYI